MSDRNVEMDVLCEMASTIVERQWYKDNGWREDALGKPLSHSFTNAQGDSEYLEEVQTEFNSVLDILDYICNPEPTEQED